jgi:hypothetical protein
MTITIPTDDPCDRARALQEVLDEFLAGKRVARATFSSANGTSQDVQYSVLDIEQIKEALRDAKAECERLSNGKRRRFAIGSYARTRYR